jgi:hypothetical protein
MVRFETLPEVEAYNSTRGRMGRPPTSAREFTMVRSIGGFAVFAFIALAAFKLLTGIFGALLGLLFTILWWAFMGFVIYVIIKMISPHTARRIRETIRGDRAGSAS